MKARRNCERGGENFNLGFGVCGHSESSILGNCWRLAFGWQRAPFPALLWYSTCCVVGWLLSAGWLVVVLLLAGKMIEEFWGLGLLLKVFFFFGLFVYLHLFMLWAKPLFKKLILTFNILFHIIIFVMNSYLDVNIKILFVSVDSKLFLKKGKWNIFIKLYFNHHFYTLKLSPSPVREWGFICMQGCLWTATLLPALVEMELWCSYRVPIKWGCCKNVFSLVTFANFWVHASQVKDFLTHTTSLPLVSSSSQHFGCSSSFNSIYKPAPHLNKLLRNSWSWFLLFISSEVIEKSVYIKNAFVSHK